MKSLMLFVRASIMMMGAGLFMVGVGARGDTGNPTAGPQKGIDDYNTSTVYPLSQVTFANRDNYEFLINLVKSGKNYTPQWAGESDMKTVDANIKAPVYEAWVVSEPAVTVTTGVTFSGFSNKLGPDNFNDVGGAAIALTYTPQAGINISNPVWVQAYYGVELGRITSPTLDSPTPPFYPTNASGTTADGTVWMVDRPFQQEVEYENNPVVALSFVTLLGTLQDSTLALDGGVTWGYEYDAVDLIVPEPGPCALLASLSLTGVSFLRRRRTC